MNTNEFNKQQDALFEYILDRGFFQDFKSQTPSKDLEFVITPNCNLSCKYCYFTNYKDKIYPKEIRNISDILTNINIILDWTIKQGFKVRKLNLFSGDIWHTEFGNKVLNIVYDKLSYYKLTDTVMIASNMTWVDNKEIFKTMSDWVDRYKKIGVTLCISASIDGKIIEDLVRPKTTGLPRSDNFYDNIKRFAKLHEDSMGFHPMVSAYSIKHWIDNYKWWAEYIESIGFSLKHSITMLEVRNDDWTEEAINDYLKFIEFRFLYEKDFLFKDDKISFVDRLYHFGKFLCSDLSLVNRGYRYLCGIQSTLYFRTGDLAIIPCHRLSYNNFIYGYFDKNTKKFKAYNPELMLRILLTNPTRNSPMCESCDYKLYCIRGCLGSQYESSKEIFHPCNSVCSLMKHKINKLLKLYSEYGFLEPSFIAEHFPENYNSWFYNYQIFMYLLNKNEV